MMKHLLKRAGVVQDSPRKIGVYGGKFDPPHVGHLMCAEMTREAFDLDLVLFVTSANPPHKKTGVSDARIRQAMVEAAVAPNYFFQACDIELRREGPSYTLDTIKALKAQYGDAELYLMLSSEYLDPEHPWHITKWKNSHELFALCRLLIFPREGHTVAQSTQWAELITEADIQILSFCPSPPVSSTLIRDRIASGASVWYMVLPEVWNIIRRKRLYGYTVARRCTFCQKYWNRLKALGRAVTLVFSR